MDTPPATSSATETRRPARLRDYVALMRPDHWVKHVFIVPGIVLAALLHSVDVDDLVLALVLGFTSAAAAASANYVLNEWLDAPSDLHHPIKSNRPAVRARLSPAVVAAQYACLAMISLGLAWRVSWLFLATTALFLIAGLVYNVPPIRTKDRVYLDVISESFNNPLRLTLGWAMVDSSTLPPGSLLLGYWMAGAFLMGVKRLAEYRTLSAKVEPERIRWYRKSFASYSAESLLVSSFLYAQMAAFFSAVFFIKYRVEYILAFPALAALFGLYLRTGLKAESVVQTPELLFRERTLMVAAVVVVVLLVVLTWVDIPILERLTDPHYIRIPTD